jgi:hypothetical protein
VLSGVNLAASVSWHRPLAMQLNTTLTIDHLQRRHSVDRFTAISR